jgi:exosortase/archaeosortase
MMSAGMLLTSVVVFAFYMSLPLELRNYGGNTSALRWMFWLAPLWSVALVAAADQFARNGFARAIALACLLVSAMSVAYPIWNPWTMPWTFNLMRYFGG